MYIAMNRFRIRPERAAEFEDVWRNRDRHLKDVPGYVAFHMLRGPATGEQVLYASHTVWKSEADFVNWTKSEAFRQAHAGAGSTKEMLLGPPQLECFTAVVEG